MDIFDYYKLAFENYANYRGRATAKEYWYFVLGHFIVSISLLIMLITSVDYNNEVLATVSGISLGLYTLAAVIPKLMISIRRLHDTGKSGWFLMFSFIPVVGPFLLIFFLAQSSDGDNIWGKEKFEEDFYDEEPLALPLLDKEDEFV